MRAFHVVGEDFEFWLQVDRRGALQQQAATAPASGLPPGPPSPELFGALMGRVLLLDLVLLLLVTVIFAAAVRATAAASC